MNEITILRDLVADFVKKRSWEKYHNPKNLSMSIAIEAAELMEIFQWLTIDEATELAMEPSELRKNIEDELADVLIYCISLANATDIDIMKVVKEKMTRNSIRFPPNN